MKLKIVLMDLEMPARFKKWGLRIAGLLVVLVGGATSAYAAGLITWSNGQTLNASDLNANFSYLQGQITAQASTIAALQGQVHPPSAFQAQLMTATQIPYAMITPVVFDSVSYDLAGEYDSKRGAFSPKQAGVYLVQCGIHFPGAITLYDVGIRKNGVELNAYDAQANTASSTIDVVSSGIFQLAAGDSLTCTAYQQSGTGQTIGNIYPDRNFFSAAMLY